MCRFISLCKNVMNAIIKHLMLDPIQRVHAWPIKVKMSKLCIPTATDLTFHNINHTYFWVFSEMIGFFQIKFLSNDICTSFWIFLSKTEYNFQPICKMLCSSYWLRKIKRILRTHRANVFKNPKKHLKNPFKPQGKWKIHGAWRALVFRANTKMCSGFFCLSL